MSESAFGVEHGDVSKAFGLGAVGNQASKLLLGTAKKSGAVGSKAKSRANSIPKVKKPTSEMTRAESNMHGTKIGLNARAKVFQGASRKLGQAGSFAAKNPSATGGGVVTGAGAGTYLAWKKKQGI